MTAASPTSLNCTAPSLLVHATGLTTTKLRVSAEASLHAASGYAQTGDGQLNASIVLRHTSIVGLQFDGLTSTNLPRGARVRKANLRVVPHADSRQVNPHPHPHPQLIYITLTPTLAQTW